MSEIIGVTFPVPKPYMKRFFEEGKTVFIKPATVFKELKPGMKLVFYQSHEDTGYVGEATIKQTSSTTTPSRSSRPSGTRYSSPGRRPEPTCRTRSGGRGSGSGRARRERGPGWRSNSSVSGSMIR